MSTIRTTNIQHPSAGAAALVLDSSGNSAFAGVPTAPTAASGTNTTQLATTAFVQSAGGLVLVASETFSAVSSISINGCFTSTYANYRIVFEAEGSTTSQYVQWRGRIAGSDTSSTFYQYAWDGITSGGSGFSRVAANAAQGNICWVNNTLRSSFSGDVINPAIVLPTHLNGLWDASSFGIYHGVAGSSAYAANTAFDGISFFPTGAGTMTGNVRIYGYKNS